MNLKQTARLLGRSERWVSAQIAKGRLPATMRGRERVIAAADIVRIGHELGVATGLPTSDHPQAGLSDVLDELSQLRRQQVAFTDYVAQAVVELREQGPPIKDRLAHIEQAVKSQTEVLGTRMDAIERRMAYIASVLSPKRTPTSVEEFAHSHHIFPSQLLHVMDAAGIGVSPAYGQADEPLLLARAHVAVAAALRVRDMTFLACADCDRPIEEQR